MDPFSHECAELVLAENYENNGVVVLAVDEDEDNDAVNDIANGAASVYCPDGSPEPVPASAGYFTTEGNPRHRTSQEVCPTGAFCVDGLQFPCPPGTYETEVGASTRCQTLCPQGTFCPEGSTNPTDCPAGTYGATEGLTTESCTGLCQTGHYCPAASTSATEYACPPGTAGESQGLGSIEDCGQITVRLFRGL